MIFPSGSDFTGAILRVDVDTDSCVSPYTIPKNNPYFNSTNQPPEIFAHGLHDPGRCGITSRLLASPQLCFLCFALQTNPHVLMRIKNNNNNKHVV